MAADMFTMYHVKGKE